MLRAAFRPTLRSTTHRLALRRTMAIAVAPLPLPPSADPSRFADFGKEVKGVNPGALTPEEFKEVEQLLYKVRRVPPSPAAR